jgi:hypothetical protein
MMQGEKMFPKIPENSETGYSKLPCNLLTSSLTAKIPKGKTFRLDCFVGLCHTGLYILNPIKCLTPQLHAHLKGDHQKPAGIISIYPAISD